MNSLTIFEQAIRSLPDDRTLRRDELWTDDFLLQQENELTVYYSPIGEYVNTEAKVVIIGITQVLNRCESLSKKRRMPFIMVFH